MNAIELIAGNLDCFCYGGYDVVLQQQTSPVAENRKYHRKRWHLYRYGKFTGNHFKTDKEAIAFIDNENKKTDA